MSEKISNPVDPRDDYIQQLEQQVRDRELEVKLLLEITDAINNQIHLEELFQAVAKRARTLVNAETVLIPILDKNCTEYTYRAGSGKNVEEIVGESLPIDFGICGWVWREKRPWWQGVLSTLDEADRNRWEKEAGSVLIVPLFGKKHFLGGISAINKIDDKEFSRRDLDLLTMFANSVTVTIENAQFFDEMETAQKQSKQYQEELEYLNREQESIIVERTRKLQKSQEQLIQSEKMAALGNLVAGISHEINTPLGVSVTSASYMDGKIKELEMRFQSDQLKRSELDNFFHDIQNGFELLHENLRRASELIRNFKQIAVDQSSDECREINLYQYMEKVILSLNPTTRRTEISVQNSVDKSLNVKTYPGVIYQIFSHFIINSITHAFTKKITDNEVISIKAWKEHNKIYMSYSDNGIGLNEEAMKKIYEPFYTTNRGSGNTGLGMSIVYNLITSTLKGNIRNKSIAEKGVCFEFDWLVDE